MIVSEASIEKILYDVAPKVEWLTEWNCSLKNLTIKIIKPNQVFAQVIMPKYKELNIDITSKTLQDKFSSWINTYLVSRIVIGVYEPATKSIVVVPNNLSASTNESGFATALGHEMVHRCQFLYNPKFVKEYNKLIKKTADPHVNNDNAKDTIQLYMTLIEGEASFVENQLRQMYYQNATIAPRLSSLFLGLTGALCFKDFRKKAAQYIRGRIMVGKEYKVRGRKGVSALYSLNPKKIRKKIHSQKKTK